MGIKENKKKTVLISVVGTSPAVVTETVWALAHSKKPVVPKKVVVITTDEGRKRLETQLLTGKPSVWEMMCKALQREGLRDAMEIEFGRNVSYLKVVPDEQHGNAADLRSVADNMRAADLMLDTIRTYSENPEYDIYASIAGGRKSMGALLLSCMSLLGRDGDHVNHVLMTPEAPGLKNAKSKGLFYFPEKGATYEYLDADKRLQKIAAGKVKIDLFDIPFVRIRGWFPEKFGELPPSYGSMVNAIRKKAPPAELLPIVRLDVSRGLCRIGDSDCPFGGLEFALLYVLAKKVFDRDEQYKVFDRLYGLRQNDLSKLPRWLREFISSARIRENSEGVRPDIYAALTWIGNNLRACLQDRMEASLVRRISPLRGRQGDYPDDRIVIVEEEKFPCVAECFLDN